MSKTQLTNGQPVPEDRSHTAIDPATGQQKGYVVLSPEERSKGFKKPLRRSYLHSCGALTTMGPALAETYARDPWFYSGTFCAECASHYPLSQFSWEPDGEPMDPGLQVAWHLAQADVLAEREKTRAEILERVERSELARLKAKYE